MTREELLAAIDKKYEAMGQDPDVHLSGLLHAEPMTYWDFAQVDALLGLQTQRTQLPDEMVFIMYHQINELLFKMILWEMWLKNSIIQQTINYHSNILTDTTINTTPQK